MSNTSRRLYILLFKAKKRREEEILSICVGNIKAMEFTLHDT